MTGQELYNKILGNKQKYIGKTINVLDGHHFVKGCKFKVFEDSNSELVTVNLIQKPYEYEVDGVVLMNVFLQAEVEIEQPSNTVDNCNVVRAAMLIGLDKPCEIEGQCIGYSVGENEEPHEECKECKLFQSYEE